jgi:predicted transcriptional regulator
MIVYRDIISGDEMITDAFKLLPVVDKEGNTVLVCSVRDVVHECLTAPRCCSCRWRA